MLVLPPPPVTATAAAAPPTASLYTVNLSRVFGPDYAPLANDLVRMVCIQLAIQLLNVAIAGSTFFSADFMALLMYIVLGVALYWLALRRIVVFR